MKGGGKNKEERLYVLATDYIYQSEFVYNKAKQSLYNCDSMASRVEIEYYLKYVKRLEDLLNRRILEKETIPQKDKIYSIFEPHTHWIVKGKSGVICELGQKMLITSDQNSFIVDWQLIENQMDVNLTTQIVEGLQQQYKGKIASHSFDKGFSKQAVNNVLQKKYPQTKLIIRKKGKCNKEEKQRESEPEFKTLYNQHNAIESNIHELMCCGMDLCPDKGIKNYRRYAALSVFTFNIKKLGQHLIKKEKRPPDRKKATMAA